MIRPSPEIEAVVRRWTDAVNRRDGAVLSNMLSRSEHLRYQGSAEGEYWRGALFRQGYPNHIREVPEYSWTEHSLEAFESGSIGWAHCAATLSFRDTGKDLGLRFTFVLVVEEGMWRFVQMHVSNPYPNMDRIGIEHKALDDLVQAARDGFRLDQREGIATVMFTDIVNSSAIASGLGDRIWAAAVQDHFDMVAEEIEGQGGQLVKSLGDGTMSSFASARAALRVAQRIQQRNADLRKEPPLVLRIGLHTGDVIQTEDDFFGTVVNKAARIAAKAAPGEIRVSDATRLMVGAASDLAFDAPDQAVLKGLDGLHTLYRLDWAGRESR